MYAHALIHVSQYAPDRAQAFRRVRARLGTVFNLTPRVSNQAWMARRTCSLTGTPSLSQTCCSPCRSSSSIRKVNVRRRAVIVCVSHCNTLSYTFPHAPVLKTRGAAARTAAAGIASVSPRTNPSQSRLSRVEAEKFAAKSRLLYAKGGKSASRRDKILSHRLFDQLACAWDRVITQTVAAAATNGVAAAAASSTESASSYSLVSAWRFLRDPSFG